MVIQNKAVKHTAKAAWKNNYIVSIALGLVLLFAYLSVYAFFQLTYMYLPTIISVISVIALFIFWLAPLALGLLRAIWQQLLENKTEVVNIFYYFSGFSFYKKALGFVFFFLIRIFGIVFVCVLPAIFVDVISSEWLHTTFNLTMPMWISNLSVISSILYFVGIVIAAIISIRFYIAPFLFVVNDDIYFLEAIHLSSVVSNDNSWEFFLLVLSFVLWFVVGNFIFPLIIIYPYFFTCYMVHCRFSIAQYNKRQDIMKEISCDSSLEY